MSSFEVQGTAWLVLLGHHVQPFEALLYLPDQRLLREHERCREYSQQARDDGSPQARLGLEPGGDGERHGQGQGDDAHGDAGAQVFINKGVNGRWATTLTAEDVAECEARAVQELGSKC